MEGGGSREFAEEEGQAVGGEGGFAADGEVGGGEGRSPLFWGPGGRAGEAEEEGEFGGVIVFVETSRGDGFDEQEMGVGEVFGDASEDVLKGLDGIAGGGGRRGELCGEVGGDEAVHGFPELAGDADAVEGALGVGAGIEGTGGDGDEAFFEVGLGDGGVCAADGGGIRADADADDAVVISGGVDEQVAGAAGEVQEMGELVFGEEVGDGGEDFGGEALGLGLDEVFGFARGDDLRRARRSSAACADGFEFGEEMFGDIENGLIGGGRGPERRLRVRGGRGLRRRGGRRLFSG